ncbi:aminotransferase-like domain-containing protein [Paenibacillus sp. MMS18-CY102]|uniref:aminotransferase-like domain-containing protein n=1 Tax=Paenibacillus sp. MMS18-CY102 TaxID=2682849 RepID=UPI0013659F1A|nr:PLP-dependent aminotransferase family protein [Paenibacillus sp. MMS18-CY102]MWC26864.1 aminotransferase class I/II-fold pyridoxal phosphate-dependent enzyme [Paenibacillus sp. MMS18-CY102]
MEYRFSTLIEQVKSSVTRDILKLTQGKGKSIISFAGGMPAEELFPLDAIRDAGASVFARGRGTLQYGLTEGYTPLREQLAARMTASGMPTEAERILLTTGSQQAIELASRVLTEPGDVVLVENPTYLAGLQIFSMQGLRVVSVPSDDDGMLLEEAEELVKRHKPRLVYVVPTFGNPTGRVWSQERREGLLALCQRYGIPIIEDDPYGEIKFDPTASYPSIYAMAGAEGGVLYTSSFSKIVAPALRAGWAAGDGPLIAMMAKAKQSADLHSSSLDQQLLSELLQQFDLEEHIRGVAAAYFDRMNEMQELLRAYCPVGVTWNAPEGGMFLWLTLPEGLDAEALLRVAIAKGVAFVPGVAFYAEEPERNTARLSFTLNTGERMAQGIRLFAEAIGEFTARS